MDISCAQTFIDIRETNENHGWPCLLEVKETMLVMEGQQILCNYMVQKTG